jgi:hypothetical protein
MNSEWCTSVANQQAAFVWGNFAHVDSFLVFSTRSVSYTR